MIINRYMVLFSNYVSTDEDHIERSVDNDYAETSIDCLVNMIKIKNYI